MCFLFAGALNQVIRNEEEQAGGLCPNFGSTWLWIFPSAPWLKSLSSCISREEWWQSSFPFNSSQACWKEPLVYVLFFMPVRSWDEILSVNHKAYYYFKYLHLPGEGARWLPVGEINGVSLLAGTLSLGKNKKRHRTSCSVYCRKCVQL